MVYIKCRAWLRFIHATVIYDYFEKNVLNEKVKLTTNEKANLFIQIVINPDENYLHPRKKNVLITKSFGKLIVNQNLFKSFFSHFEGNLYSPKEKEELTALVDRLVEDSTRRKKGEFFTPTSFVDLAHKYIGDVFGDDWKERFIVWDCAWGTGNLTRDYKFSKLYCSTLELSDIDTANQMGYNPEAVKFQFDFLNDPDDKLPIELQEAIRNGKEILFLINPPYATASNMGTKEGDHKAGVAKTLINRRMLNEGWGSASQSLYAQFLYRIAKYQEINKNICIGVFCKPLYLTGISYKEFRKKFFSLFGFENGFLFKASHFSDVAEGWCISFSVFSNKTNNNNKTDFIHHLIDFDEDDNFLLVNKGIKNLYNTDYRILASEWVREEIRKIKTFDAPQISSAIKIKQNGVGKIVQNALGYLFSNANNVQFNQTNVAIFSGAASAGHGLSIISENYYKCNNLFTARRLILNNWINHKDEYLAPNESHPLYEQFTYDSIVYSLFNNSSQQSSLRQVEYKGRKWDIKNEFFWMSKNEMLNLAEQYYFDELYKDAKTSDERFVYKKLFKEGIYQKLSPDAKEVLDMATDLVKKSFEMRKLVAENHPEYHLHSWDAGYAQLKLVWKEYFKEEFNLFREKYKQLENRLRPLVYELGFLLN